MKTRLFAFSCLFLFALPLLAQDKARNAQMQNDPLFTKDVLQNSEPTLPETIPMDAPVDPAEYIVGPSDIFTVAIIGAVNYFAPLAVAPEGGLIIPTVGEVPVAGKTLLQARELVVKAIRRRYTAGEITVALTAPRPIIVHLRGAVLHPGQYTATSVDRVENIVRKGTTPDILTPSVTVPLAQKTSAGSLDVPELPRLAQPQALYENASMRNILLIRRNHDTVRVDLQRYFSSGDAACNPRLREGDVIFVPQRNFEGNSISIHGAVNAPGVYEYAANDRLLDAIAIAQGFLLGAAIDRVTVSRLDRNGETRHETSVDAASLAADASSSAPLQPGDQIIVSSTRRANMQYTAAVKGEVAQPGTYPIMQSMTRLSELVRIAGGLTVRALPAGSVLLRRMEKLGAPITPQYEILHNWRSSQLNIPDSSFFVHLLREGMTPVAADLEAALRGDTAQDVVLLSGDVLFIATDDHTVLVEGQVARPGFQPCIAGGSLEEYLRRAGGVTESAEESDIRILKRGTRAWLEPDETSIESGDIIWIPKHIPHDFSFYLTVFRDVATVTTALATTLLLIYQIQNTK